MMTVCGAADVYALSVTLTLGWGSVQCISQISSTLTLPGWYSIKHKQERNKSVRMTSHLPYLLWVKRTQLVFVCTVHLEVLKMLCQTNLTASNLCNKTPRDPFPAKLWYGLILMICNRTKIRKNVTLNPCDWMRKWQVKIKTKWKSIRFLVIKSLSCRVQFSNRETPATGGLVSVILCSSQARINGKGCVWKGLWCKPPDDQL